CSEMEAAMNSRYQVVAASLSWLLLLLAAPAAVYSQPVRDQPPEPKPRIAVMSEVVARQKLATYGVTNVSELRRVGDQYVVKGVYNNRPVEFEMNAQSGLLRDKVSKAQIAPAANLRERMVTGPQLKITREDIVRPERIRVPGGN
ncbi:MAG: hypothetical protein ACREQF_13690, partial [Candidatus Binataceae bacterium]